MQENSQDRTRTIQLNDGWSVPTADGVGRRTLVQGAAWMIPVVAVAAGAPLAAASAPTCPTVQNRGQWVVNGPTQGGFWQGTNEWGQNGEWVSDADALYGQTGETRYTLTTTMPVVAGTTYTIQQTIAANHVVPPGFASYPQGVSLRINGTQVFQGWTIGGRGGELLPDGQYRTYEAIPYTATTTGTITLQYIFAFDPTVRRGDVSDSITILLPTIECS